MSQTQELLGPELVVVLGLAILLAGVLPGRLSGTRPLLLIGFGVLIGFVPAFRVVHLAPTVVLFVFLPVLLFWESLTTSMQEIRAALRGILLVSTLLVVVEAAAVAVVVHALRVPWGPAWVLGAALAPTDATAVGVIGRSLPRRMLTVLRAESLVNDGTALVLLALAIGTTAGRGHLATGHVAVLFVRSYVGGVLAGLLVVGVTTLLRRRLSVVLPEVVLVLLTPFAAFVLAELVSASGVLAVVTAGLLLTQVGQRADSPQPRQLAGTTFALSTYLLNGALFALIGIEAQSAVRGLTSVAMTRALVIVVVVVAVLFSVRVAFLFVSAYLIRGLDRRPAQRLRRVSHRSRIVSGFAGVRGAVSLAAALSVPELVDAGTPFPDRDLVVFVTAGVIALTLLQGLALPAVARWAHLPADTSAEERDLAELTATTSALDALPRLAAELGTDQPVVDAFRAEFQRHLEVLQAGQSGDDDGQAVRWDRQHTALRLAVLAHKRSVVVDLRDARRIDDMVLKAMQTRLDREEVRLTQPDMVE